MSEVDKKLFIVSNRLPIIIAHDDDDWKVNPSSGGLITALAPLMKRNHGTWLGWPGCGPEAPVGSLLEGYSKEQGYDLKPVLISDEEVERYYRGFSNQTVWPLFHDLLGYCSFDAENWGYYTRVNEKFAEKIAALA
ncbi:MAG: trehalose-6-phosphate synthase, partial [Candidatus Zixiibacteriota bacterium]